MTAAHPGSLAGHHALVTGGGTGLGAGAALALAADGAQVTIAGRTQATLEETVAAASGLPGTIRAIQADVTSEESVEALVEAADAHVPLTILVTAAGVNYPGPTVDTTMTEVDRIFDTNIRGTFLAARAVGRRMLDRGDGGRIVLLSSQMGEVGYPGRAAYCASKHAVNGMVKALAVEWASHGITVNAVSPTFVITPLTKGFFDDPAFADDVLRRIPAGRLAEVDHISGAVRYLVSDVAAMTTGQILGVDGGWTAW
ncbi:MAG: SDR family oxidoreductase [Solirubrobacteraceae bacterium]|nr:SDR family oxidoreductase [Solirubrobacteraceae bacterium]